MGKLRAVPAISVIMLAWNSAPYLLPAVDSVLNQTMTDLELLVVDNGSTDGSVDELERMRPDPRLRILRQGTNLGIAAGTNLGIAAARSPWIAIADGDDCSHPRRFECALQLAAVDPSVAIVGTGVVKTDAGGRELGEMYTCHTPEEIRQFSRFHMPVQHATLHVRREVYAEIPYRPEFNSATDFDWVMRAVERHRARVVAAPLYRYRRHEHASTVARLALNEAYVCAARLAGWRRAAGRAEEAAALGREAAAIAGGAAPAFADVYRHFARRARRDGFPDLSAFHSLLACRHRRTIPSVARLLADLAATVVRRPAAMTGAARGMIRGVLAASGLPEGARV